MFTEAFLKIAEPAKGTVGFKLNNPKIGDGYTRWTIKQILNAMFSENT